MTRTWLRAGLALALSMAVAEQRAAAQGLAEAIRQGEPVRVRTLLDSGADPNACASDLMTPLQRAADRGSLTILRLLLEKGAKVDGTCAGGRTALMAAIDHDHLDVAQALVEAKANVDAQRVGGFTALIQASMDGRIAAVKLLLAAGAKTGLTDDNGMSPYDWAISRQRADVLEALTGKPVDRALLKTGYKAMMDAIFTGDVAKVKEIISSGADVNARIDVITPLEWAVSGRQQEVVSLLLEARADPNKVGPGRKTPLIAAAETGQREIVRLLLAHGADRTARNSLGQSASDLAKRNNHPDVVALLASATVPPPAPVTKAELDQNVVRAAISGSTEKVSAALARGGSVNARLEGGAGMTALMFASSLPVVQLLLDKGADPNLQSQAGQTALILAASHGELDVVRLLLDRGANPALKDIGGRTALELAANEGHTDVVKLLTEHGSRLNTKGNALADLAAHTGANAQAIEKTLGPEAVARARHSVSALVGAAERGDAELVQLLLSQGADANGADIYGKTPLIAAIAADRAPTALLLLEHGANPNLANDQGDTPLMVAAARPNAKIAEALMARGAQVNAADKSGVTPLMNAVSSQGLDVAKLLVAKGANLAAVDPDGRTAFYYNHGLPGSAGDARILLFLIESGIDVNARTRTGETPLMHACGFSTLEVVRALLDKGAAVSAVDKDGGTALHMALASHAYNRATVLLLLDHGADINAASNAGVTPLMVAFDVEIARVLIERGARADAVDKSGKNALYYKGLEDACAPDVAAFLIEKGVPADVPAKSGATPFMYALDHGCDDVARVIMQHSANINVNVRGLRGYTPLIELAYGSDDAFFRQLLERGADVRAKADDGITAMHLIGSLGKAEMLASRGAEIDARDNQGMTPLMRTSINDLMKWFIAKGADVNARAKDGRTALMGVRSHEAADLLIKAGADVNAKTVTGMTALMMAAERGDIFIAQVLLAAGADRNARTTDGQTALSIAIGRSNTQMAELLRR